MTSVLKVDTLQNLNSSTIITQTNATTLTLGTSGQTISIPSGVTFNTASATVTLPSTINATTINVTTVVLAAGAVGTPSLTTSDDTNTGIFFPSADTIAFTEGGTEVMRINSSGNVGIGTGSPTYKFQVEGFNSNRFVAIEDTGLLVGGIGASETGGVLNWNDATNARSGSGKTLLQGTATNGPGGTTYFHSFTFEYADKNATGNMTQWAIAYNSNGLRYQRFRLSGVWSAWSAF
jgi:hypothetical protein